MSGIVSVTLRAVEELAQDIVDDEIPYESGQQVKYRPESILRDTRREIGPALDRLLKWLTSFGG